VQSASRQNGFTQQPDSLEEELIEELDDSLDELLESTELDEFEELEELEPSQNKVKKAGYETEVPSHTTEPESPLLSLSYNVIVPDPCPIATKSESNVSL